MTLYDHPLRVAEEIAMLDVISGGRVISGLVVGTGNEFFSYNVNPTYARERFHEAHELILKAWTRARAVRLGGQRTTASATSTCGRKPMQKPHPPIWIPGSGSQETIEWVAEHRYTYMVLPTLAPYELRARTAEQFREACERDGLYERATSRSAGASACTSPRPMRRAVAEYEPHFWYYARNLLRNRDTFNAPPGHSSIDSLLGDARAPPTLATRQFLHAGKRSSGPASSSSAVPSPSRDRLQEIARATGLGTLVPNFSVGNVPHHLTRKSMQLFAEEVMPALRPLNVDAEPARAA